MVPIHLVDILLENKLNKYGKLPIYVQQYFVVTAASDASDDGLSSDDPLPAASSGQPLSPSSPSFPPAVDPRFVQSTPSAWSATRRVSRAAFLRHATQDALERVWRVGVWCDATFAEAALIIALYESSAHPVYHPDRLARTLVFLDEILSALGLTAADATTPDVCRYARGAASVVAVRPSAECACLPPGSPPRDLDTGGSSVLPWDARAEEHLLLFPNEVYDRERGGRAGGNAKNAICALFCRRMRLAHFGANVAGRAAWHETQAIQDAHGCNLHTAGAYLCRMCPMCGAQKAIAKILAAVAAVVCRALPVPAVQSPAGDRKSGLAMYTFHSFICAASLADDARFVSSYLLLWENDTSRGAVRDLPRPVRGDDFTRCGLARLRAPLSLLPSATLPAWTDLF
ncbi:hypothetical protein FB451DRAFT_1404059 [Mycena latifolia]|nr:hypothetical protein FB451DRAFT_1404059 [Mycena latifolia]